MNNDIGVERSTIDIGSGPGQRPRIDIDIESERGQALDALRRAADDIVMLRRRIEELGFYERAFLVVERALMGEPVRGGMMHPDPLWAARQAIELLERGGKHPLDPRPAPVREAPYRGVVTSEMGDAGVRALERFHSAPWTMRVREIYEAMAAAAPVDHEFDEVEPAPRD